MPRALIHLLIIFVILAALIFLKAVGPLDYVLDFTRQTVLYLNKPLVQVLTVNREFFVFISNLRDVARQNAILSRQVAELAGSLAKLEGLGEENRVLREALGLTSRSKLALISAEVIGFDPQSVERSVILGRGSRHSVAAGDAVVGSSGVMVGVISTVSERTSQMELITSGKVVVNARTSNGSATGVVRGEHGLGLLFDLIGQDQTVKLNDRIVTSGLGGQFPQDLLIGTVGEIRSSPSELFQKASVIPAANLRNLQVVFVVKPP